VKCRSYQPFTIDIALIGRRRELEPKAGTLQEGVSIMWNEEDSQMAQITLYGILSPSALLQCLRHSDKEVPPCMFTLSLCTQSGSGNKRNLPSLQTPLCQFDS
jgi:hypothetical protein